MPCAHLQDRNALTLRSKAVPLPCCSHQVLFEFVNNYFSLLYIAFFVHIPISNNWFFKAGSDFLPVPPPPPHTHTHTTWTIVQQNGPDHLGLWCNALPEHQMALITSGCVPFRSPTARGRRRATKEMACKGRPDRGCTTISLVAPFRSPTARGRRHRAATCSTRTLRPPACRTCRCSYSSCRRPRCGPNTHTHTQHGLSSKRMALITSDCGTMRSPSITRPVITSVCGATRSPAHQMAVITSGCDRGCACRRRSARRWPSSRSRSLSRG